MSRSDYIKIERLQWGQPRPYADTVREVRMTFTRDDWRTQTDPAQPKPIIPNPTTHEEAEKHLRIVLPDYKTKDEARAWWEPTLQEFKQEQPHVWYALITETYNG